MASIPIIYKDRILLNKKHFTWNYLFSIILLILFSFGFNLEIKAQSNSFIHSGFEPNTSMFVYNQDFYGFQGTDNSVLPPFDLDEMNAVTNYGFHCQMGSPGTTSDRNAYLTNDPINPLNTVLAFEINNATEPGTPFKGRVSCNILDI